MKSSWKIMLIAVLCLALAVVIPSAIAQQEKPEIKHPNTFINDSFGSANTLDYSYSYDTASGEIIMQVYENLVRYPYGICDGNECHPEDASTSQFKPMLATVVPSRENGLIVDMPDGGVDYQFPIRKGVTFHNGNKLTPEDVAYSFRRTMIQDRDGGPAWMIIQPLMGISSGINHIEDLAKKIAGVDKFKKVDDASLKKACETLTNKIEVKGNNVIFHLPEPYPPFLNILAHGSAWSAIVDKQWVIEQGGWDGSCEDWVKYHNPGGGTAAEESPLYDVANGTGPWKLERWDVGNEVVFTRNEDYWGTPPKLEKYVIKKIDEFSTRKLEFLEGDADIAYVPMQYIPQVEGQPGVKVWHNLPTIQMNPVMFFTTDLVTKGNDLVGSGKLDGKGIPSDFFNDVKVRRAFVYAFDYQTYIKDVWLNEGYKTNGPVPKALQPYYNDQLKPPSMDLEKAEKLLKEARDGEIWKKGFKFTLLYNTGNESRKVACEILERNIESLNPKFDITVRGVDWSTYLDKMVTTKMPLFTIGWLADFPDPHNFVKPFMASDGTFSGWQGDHMIQLAKEKYDPLIKKGMSTTKTEVRKDAYYKLQEYAHVTGDAIDIFLPQPAGVREVRTWVQNYPFNPMFPGPYAYPVYKAYEEVE